MKASKVLKSKRAHQTVALLALFCLGMLCACEPEELWTPAAADMRVEMDEHGDYDYTLIDRHGDLEWRRIFPPVRVRWASPDVTPGDLDGGCYTIGGLVEVTHEHIVIAQTQYPTAGYYEHELAIRWVDVIEAYNYELDEPVKQPGEVY